ncbi:MAG: HlyD family efflux transporter periplasmic adaptor subunit [Myxococcota bacterium]
MSMKADVPPLEGAANVPRELQGVHGDDRPTPTAPVAPAPPSRVVQPRLPKWLTGALALAILIGGVAAAVLFVKTKKSPPKKPPVAVVPLVEVVTVSTGTRPVSMQLQGEVMPSAQVVVMPEVTGKVVWQSEQLVPGGTLEAGDPLVRIDASDYALNLRQQQSQLAANRLQLELEEGRKRVATEEWELFQEERRKAGLPATGSPGKALATREPHLESAKVAVKSAQSGIQRAALQLDRTTIKAPFNAIVRAESVDRGQVVSPGMQLATLVGTDTYWVRVSIPLDQLTYVRFPRDGEAGSNARVSTNTGNGRTERDGRVVRLLSDLDPVGRLARILVEVDDPLGAPASRKADDEDAAAAATSGGTLPLLLGSYVTVEIEGVEVSGLAEVPRIALQEEDRVYALTADDTLRIVDVDIVWGDRDHVLVRGDLEDGDRLVTSTLPTAVEGMTLRAITSAENGGERAPSDAEPSEEDG